MIREIQTLPPEKRKEYPGRHMVASGRPARFLRDALLTGNGQHRLFVFGNPEDEIVLLCQEDLYLPSWKNPPTAPPIAEVLDEVRKLLLEGKYEEASYRAMYASLAKGVSDKWQPPRAHEAFALNLKQPVRGRVRDYLRQVNLRNGVITVRWADDTGSYKREALVPRTDENIALVRLSGPEAAPLEVRLALLREKGVSSFLHSLDGSTPAVAEVAEGAFHWDAWTVDKTTMNSDRPQLPEVKTVFLKDAILVTGTYDPRFEKGGYAAALLIKGADFTTRLEGTELVIQAHSPLTLLMKAASFPVQSSGDTAGLLEELRAGAIEGDFSRFAIANEKTHGVMFDRMELDLGGDERDYLLTTEELQEKERVGQGINPVYMEKMVDMGRYFLLCESGKWPPIYGHVNININHQLSAANIGALSEMMDVFMRWIEWQLPDARENARLVFGAAGFLIACHPDTESGKLYHFSHLYPHHYWISGSGWCLQPFLEYYYCTGDETFLKERMLPLYVELARFYRDYLKLSDGHGKWIFAPSYSPENWPANTLVQTAVNATMDITVCREVMETLLELGPKVGIGTLEERAEWQAIREKLPEYLVGEQGELKEWAWPDLQERYDHRHLSHLYGAYPGDEFQPENDPGIYKAAFIANRMRAQENSSAHGIIHRAQIAARLKDPYLVYQNLKQILETGFVNTSFSTRHNPYISHYMPDAQGGLPTIVLESLLYSRPGVLELLPALPWCWPKGVLKGMVSRTFARIEELRWDLKEGEIYLVLMPLKDQELVLLYRPGIKSLSLNNVELSDGLATPTPTSTSTSTSTSTPTTEPNRPGLYKLVVKKDIGVKITIKIS